MSGSSRSEEHRARLWTAALDLKLETAPDVVVVTSPPGRWDELLDTRLPLLVSCQAGSWSELGAALWEAGCPIHLPLRLVESQGRVSTLSWKEESLIPSPTTAEWVLCLGWSHPDEGWRSRLPLWGRRYVVTRAAGQGESFVERLVALGAQAYAVPTIAFEDPDDLAPWREALATMSDYSWILLTSPNGVDAFVRRLGESPLDLRVLGKARFGCIGPSTAKALGRHGLKADLVPTEYVAEGLLAALKAELGPSLAGQRILLPRAQVARSVLPDELRAAGAEVLVAPVYKTVPPPLEALPASDPSNPPRLLFTSSSTVDNWVAAAGLERSWACYCIGPITAATARRHGIEVLGVAQEYTIDGLVARLLAPDKAGGR